MKASIKILFCLELLLWGCSQKETVHPDGSQKEPQVLLVKFREGCVPGDGAGYERVFPDCWGFAGRTHEAGLDRWYIAPSGLDATRSDIAEIIEPQGFVKPDGFNDPYGRWQENLTFINVYTAREKYDASGSGVIVAVIDGGIDTSHQDLENVVIRDSSRCFLEGQEEISPTEHGTNVAGIIAAISNNRKDLCGIAGGDSEAGIPGARLISCQIFDADYNPGSVSDVARAIKWAADHGAVICQNSWNHIYNSQSEAMKGYTSSLVRDAIDYFNTYAGYDSLGHQTGPMAGGVVFFSAGNEGWRYAHPADYEGVLAVGALNGNSRASYSNYGEWVDLWAPGGTEYKGIYTLESGGSVTGSFYGTSASCPQASGVAALVLSAFGGTGFTREMLVERMLRGTSTGVILDALSSMQYGENQTVPLPVTDLTATATRTSINLKWTVPEGNAYGYAVKVMDSGGKVINAFASGESSEFTVNGLAPSSTYTVTVTSYNSAHKFSEPSKQVTISTLDNHSPSISINCPQPVRLQAWQSVNIPIIVSDSDGDPVTVKWERASLADTLDGSFIKINASKAEPGEYTIILYAADSLSGSAQCSIKYILEDDVAPVLLKELENIKLMVKSRSEIKLDEYFASSSGEVYKYDVSVSDGSVLAASLSGDSIMMTALFDGVALVKLTVCAARKTYEYSFKVYCRSSLRSFYLYPNPVSDALCVQSEEEQTGRLIIVNQLGKKVYSADNVIVSPFEPFTVNVSFLSRGSYQLMFEDYKVPFVKL